MAFFDYIKKKKEAKSTIDASRIQELTEELLVGIKEGAEQHPQDMQEVDKFVETLAEELGKHMEKEVEDPEDAICKLYVGGDKMTAFAVLFPPIGKGQPISLERLKEDLRYEGVCNGVDERVLEYMISSQKYCHLFAVARGESPVDGVDGQVKEFFERKKSDNLLASEDHIINFKEIALYQSVRKGDIICRIKPPKEGHDGKNVIGAVLPCKQGMAANVKAGEHTQLSGDGSKLTALIEGTVSFENDMFCVEEKKLVDGNVDYTTGNIDFPKDVLISGDICNGCKIIAGGDVVVCGMMKEGTIEASGTIRIQNGVQGHKECKMISKKDIQCLSIENAYVEAAGDIYAEVIMNSQVISRGSVYCLAGRGMIVGGSISVADGIEAKRIGNQSGCDNVIHLCYSPEKKQELDDLNTELQSTQEVLDKIRKNLASLKGVTVLSLEKKTIMEQLSEQRKLYKQKEDMLIDKIQVVKRSFVPSAKCKVVCDTVFPVTEINCGEKKLVIKEEVEGCNVHMHAGEIVIH